MGCPRFVQSLIVLETPHPLGPGIASHTALLGPWARRIVLAMPLECPEFFEPDPTNRPVQEHDVHVSLMPIHTEATHLMTCACVPQAGVTIEIRRLIAVVGRGAVDGAVAEAGNPIRVLLIDVAPDLIKIAPAPQNGCVVQVLIDPVTTGKGPAPVRCIAAAPGLLPGAEWHPGAIGVQLCRPRTEGDFLILVSVKVFHRLPPQLYGDRKIAFIFLRVHVPDHTPLMQVGFADDGTGLSFDALQRGHQYRHQKCNDGDYHQKLDQSKSPQFAHDTIISQRQGRHKRNSTRRATVGSIPGGWAARLERRPRGCYNAVVKRLYWTNPDICEIEVEVKSVGDSRVTTDPIVFHPDEGGQPADRGAIGPADVVNIEVTDSRIVHTLSEPLGDGRYLAKIDKQHRLDTARQHTAQHIISGVAESRFGLKTTGVHIGLQTSTVDFDKKAEWQTLQAIELQAMKAVAENITVETAFDESDVRSRFDMSQIESDTIRVVKIGKYDASACCGAHVLRTGDIGTIRFIDIESKKDGTRVHFVAGTKALEFSQTETATLRELRKMSKCSTLELPVILQKALDQSRSLAKEVDRLHGSMLPSFVAAAQMTQIGASKVGVQVDAVANKYAGKLAALIAEKIDGTGIVVSGCNVAISSKTLDAREILQKLRRALGGKGGGSPRSANGRLEKTVTSEQIVEIIKVE